MLTSQLIIQFFPLLITGRVNQLQPQA